MDMRERAILGTNENVLDYSANAQGRQDCYHYWTVGRWLTTKGDTP